MNEEVINLAQIVKILKKRAVLILTLTCLGGILATAISYFFLEPEYSSSSLILVNRKNDTNEAVQYQQVQTDLQMINTYKDIITKEVVLNQAKKNLEKAGYVPGNIDHSITLSNNTNSQVISVNASASDPYLARAIANEVVAVFREKLTKIMPSAKNVSVISKGSLNTAPVKPRHLLNIFLGLVVGILAGVVLAFFSELTDNTVKDLNFITGTLGLPLLGTITDIDQEQMKMGSARKRPTAGRSNRRISMSERRSS